MNRPPKVRARTPIAENGKAANNRMSLSPTDRKNSCLLGFESTEPASANGFSFSALGPFARRCQTTGVSPKQLTISPSPTTPPRAAVFEPEIAARWITRLGSSDRIGFDLTGATRIAEATYQIQRLAQDSLGLFFGFGHAAETYFAGPAAKLVASVLGASGADYSGHGYGHNFYVGLVYVGGLLFGGPVILSFAAMLLKARSFARRRWADLTPDGRFI